MSGTQLRDDGFHSFQVKMIDRKKKLRDYRTRILRKTSG